MRSPVKSPEVFAEPFTREALLVPVASKPNKDWGVPGAVSPWLRYEESLNGIAKASADIGKQNDLPPWVFRYLKRVKMFTVQDGELAKDF